MEAVPQWGICRRQKRPERVNRKGEQNPLQGLWATIEIADIRTHSGFRILTAGFFRKLNRRSGSCCRCKPLLVSLDSLTSFSPLANAQPGHHSDRSPTPLQVVCPNPRRVLTKRKSHPVRVAFRLVSPAGFFRSLNRRLSRLERARCSFRANELRSLPASQDSPPG